jgi:hypothetical protein
MAKPRARRNRETQELEPPWAGIRQQWAAIPEAEQRAAERRAQQLVEQGWGAVDWG